MSRSDWKYDALVLCHGNVNRSALCAAILREEGLRVASGGFVVQDGKRAAKKTRDEASKYGYDLDEHRSTCIVERPELFAAARYIIIMDGGNEKRLKALPFYGPRIMEATLKLGHFAFEPRDRVADPGFMKRDSDEFHSVIGLVVECSKRLAQYLRLECPECGNALGLEAELDEEVVQCPLCSYTGDVHGFGGWGEKWSS